MDTSALLVISPRNVSNPHLCQECQYLNDPLATVDYIGPYVNGHPVDLQSLSRRQNCIMCRAVFVAVDGFRQGVASLKELPLHRILVKNNGLRFLDDESIFTPMQRIDMRNPTRKVIRLIMNLHIGSRTDSKSFCMHPELSALPESLQTLPGHFDIPPQFCLVYSQGPQSELVSIEPWEVPYFDVSLLRDWLRDCENLHQGQCVAFQVNPAETGTLSIVGHRTISQVIFERI
jgi:hypothetical protein